VTVGQAGARGASRLEIDRWSPLLSAVLHQYVVPVMMNTRKQERAASVYGRPFMIARFTYREWSEGKRRQKVQNARAVERNCKSWQIRETHPSHWVSPKYSIHSPDLALGQRGWAFPKSTHFKSTHLPLNLIGLWAEHASRSRWPAENGRFGRFCSEMNRCRSDTSRDACNAPERRYKQVPVMALIINTRNLRNNLKNEAIASFLLFNHVSQLLLLKFRVLS
jgi:hypothetical protein